jgi:hypothetical protein
MQTHGPTRPASDDAESGNQPGQAQRGRPEVRAHRVLLPEATARERKTFAREAADRAGAVTDTAATLTGVYEAGELERLREDWPE